MKMNPGGEYKKGPSKYFLELKKKNVDDIYMRIISYMREGATIEQFLTDFQISIKAWRKFVLKNKKLQDAIEEGTTYYTAYYQGQLKKYCKDRERCSALSVRMFEQTLGWKDETAELENKRVGPGYYQVIVEKESKDESK